MTERDWTDGSAWGEDKYEETCSSCGAVNVVTIKEGPPSGHEKIEPDCAKCGHGLETGEAFGLVSVVLA